MSQIHCSLEQPTIYPIKEIINEAKGFKTFIFEGILNALPGQFVMFWIPGIDMKPFSISHQTESEFHITVMKVGDFTKKMFELKKGDKVGIQGPYGRPFTFNEGEKIIIVGGGCGIAPVMLLAHEAKKKNKRVYFIGGCRNKDAFIKRHEIEQITPQSFFLTDDGSLGKKGYTTDALEEILNNTEIDQIFACGPEKMLVRVAQIAKDHNVDCQISMERYMKCGFGICGQCCLDGCGLRVCHEGPVFDGNKLLQSKEFGNYKRDGSGAKVGL